MINKNQFSIKNDKKVLHKIGKKWVTVSALTLALLGATSVAGHMVKGANADSTQNNGQGAVNPSTVHSAGNAVSAGNVKIASQGVQAPVQSVVHSAVAPRLQQSAVAQPKAQQPVQHAVQQPSSAVQRPVQSSAIGRQLNSVRPAIKASSQARPVLNSAVHKNVSASAKVQSNGFLNSLRNNGRRDEARVANSNITSRAKNLYRGIMNNSARPKVLSQESNAPKVDNKGFKADKPEAKLNSDLTKMPFANPENKQIKSANRIDFNPKLKRGIKLNNHALMLNTATGNNNSIDVSVSRNKITNCFMFQEQSDSDEIVASPLYITGNQGDTVQLNNSQVPKGFAVVNSNGVTEKPSDVKFKLLTDGVVHPVEVSNKNVPSDEDDIPVSDNSVTFTGAINLHFSDGNGNTFKNLVLPYSVKTASNQKIDLLIHGNPSVSIPQDYLNKVIQQFQTKNFSYEAKKSSPSDSYNLQVDPSQAPNIDGDNVVHGSVDLYFNSNTVNDSVHYQYNGKDNEGNHTFSGKNDDHYNFPNSDKNSDDKTPGLNPGYHVDPNDKGFNYNGNPDTVNVLPDKRTNKVHFIVSDAKANNNSDMSDYTTTGNDYRAKDAGDNTFNVDTTKVPKGYHIVPGQKITNLNYDGNQNNNIKIIGNDHNSKDSNNKPSDNKPTDPSDMSDTVNVTVKEYNNGKFVRQFNKYIAESGKTGEAYNVDPSTFTPKGYSVSDNDKALQGKFTPSGIDHKSVTWNYNANAGQLINVAYINQNGVKVESGTVSGNVDTTGNIYTTTDKQGSKLSMPAGYHFVSASDDGTALKDANGNNIPYTITTDGQNINVHVAGNQHTAHTPVPENHPTTPSDTPSDNQTPGHPKTNPTQPSDVPNTPDNPNKPVSPTNPVNPNKPSGNKPVTPSDASDTFYVTVRDWNGSSDSHLVRTYTKRFTLDGETGNSYSVNPSTFATNGYKMTSSDQPVSGQWTANGLSVNHVTYNYDALNQSAPIHYQPTTGSNIPASDNNNGNGTLNGTTDSDVKPSDQVPVPKGYHYPKNNGTVPNYHFGPKNNQSDNVPVDANVIKGTATVHLRYVESDGTVDNTKDVQIPINGHVGDSAIHVSPWDYYKMFYNNKNNDFVIPMDWKVAPTGENDNYDPSATFTYKTRKKQSGAVIVYYADIHKNENGQYDNPKVIYGHDKYGQPIVGKQNLGVLGNIGQTVYLGSHDGTGTTYDNDPLKNVLQVPTGYHLVHNQNRYVIVKVTLQHGLQKVMVFLGMDNPAKPAKSASASAKSASAKPASASSVVPSSASASVAPSASSSAKAPSASSAEPSAKSSANTSVAPKSASANSNASDRSRVNNMEREVNKLNDQINNLENDVKKRHASAKPSHKAVIPKAKHVAHAKSANHQIIEPAQNASTDDDDNDVQPIASTPVSDDDTSANVSAPSDDVSVPQASDSTGSAQESGKLPQTGETNNKLAGAGAVSALLLGLGLAGVDLDRKHRARN